MITASDAVVCAKYVLDAIVRLRRLGRDRVTSELEALEPELLEYALEELTAMHAAMADLGLRARDVRRLTPPMQYHHIVTLFAPPTG
jgi:hypothetical protein